MTGASCGTASPTVASEHRLRITPIAPSSVCAVTSTTVRSKFGSRMEGEATRTWPASDSMTLSLPPRGEAGENPLGVQGPARVRPAVDQDEIARTRVHREPRLGGIVAVVAPDQLVDLVEIPQLCEPLPLARESLLVVAVLRSYRRPGLAELTLVVFDRELDRPHPDPVLRMEARRVEDFDDDLVRLVDRMRELMKDANGVGLAATQVGVLRRVFVFSPDEDVVAVLVNPELVRKSEEVDVDDEGCLSMQG